MITKEKRQLRYACRSLAVAVAVLLLAATDARAQGLLGQCWPASALQGHLEERPPRRGAAGHAQSIPKVRLAPFAAVPAARQGAIRRVALPKGRKLVALTFDLCEQPGEVAGYDGAIVDYLRANDVRATFFSGGKWLLTHAERTEQLMADARFEIGSHGWAHRNARGLSGQALTSEVVGPQAAYEAVRARLGRRQCVAAAPAGMARVAPRMSLYRFPYGACNAAALAETAANGLLAVQWDVSTGDASPTQSAAAIASVVLRQVRPGSIVLMHANGRGYNTAAALPLLIPKLRAQGYELVTVSELLAAGEPEIVQSCYDARPGDTDRYDRLFAAARRDGFRTEVHRAR